MDARRCRPRHATCDSSLPAPTSPINIYITIARCRSAAEAALVRDLLQAWRTAHYLVPRPLVSPNFPPTDLADHADLVEKIRACPSVAELKEVLAAMLDGGELQRRLAEDIRSQPLGGSSS